MIASYLKVFEYQYSEMVCGGIDSSKASKEDICFFNNSFSYYHITFETSI